MSRRPRAVLLVLALALLGTSLVSLLLGLERLTRLEFDLVVFHFRLPRLVLAVLIGAGVSVSGAVLQGVSRNDLASPDTLGVNAGSGLGIMLLLLLFPTAVTRAPLLLPLAAVVGALGVTAVVFSWAYQQGSVLPARLLLVGVAVGFGAQAAMILFGMRMSFVLYNYALTWLSGTLAGSNWASVLLLLPWSALLLPLAWSQARTLNILSLGDAMSTGLGVSVERRRLLLLGTATLLTSACVAVGGQIGFLGLAAPHLARRLTGPNHSVLLPAAGLGGATLLVLADGLVHHLPGPVELPAGILVGILGGSYFLYLLVRHPR